MRRTKIGRLRRRVAVARPWHTNIDRLRIRDVSPLELTYKPLLSRLRHLVKLLGNNQTAELLGVANSQPSRWLRGERVSAESAKRISDIDYVLDRALHVFYPDEAAAFFTFAQPFLNGARPIDVLVTRGVGPVIAALEQIDEGAYI